MIDHLRTLFAHIVTRWLPGPRELLIRAWAWLCADTDDLDEKQCCLEAILELGPGLDWANQGLRLVEHQRRTVNESHPASGG